MSLCTLLTLAVAAATSPDAAQLLRDSDRARGNLEKGVTWTVEVTSTAEGTTTQRTFLVRARGDDALAEAIAPPRHKGEIFLFNDRTIWFIKPGLRRPVSVSARQRLQGEAANGDIATTHFARDYDAELAGEDLVGAEPAWRLELKAKNGDVTYDRIRYWVSKARHLALKAEFLTVGGDVFKTATMEYGNHIKLYGADLDMISRISIRDAMGTGNVTVMSYTAPKAETHAPSIFNVNNVVR